MKRSIIDTPKLYMREFSVEDALMLQPVLAHPKVMRFSIGQQPLSNMIHFIRHQIHSYEQNGFGLWALMHKEQKRIIGYSGLALQNIGEQLLIELSYQIDPIFWGQGIGLEAALAVKQFAFSSLGIPNLIAIIPPENRASIQVAQKLYMEKEGELVFENTSVDIYLTEFFSIETDRLIIRELVPEDEPILKAMFDNIDPFFSNPLYKNISLSRSLFIENQRKHHKIHKCSIWAITLDEELIGLGGINPQQIDGTVIHEFYISLGKKYRGIHLGKEAAHGILDYAQNTLNLSPIISLIEEKDRPSRHLVESLGMHLTKEMAHKTGKTLLYTL